MSKTKIIIAVIVLLLLVGGLLAGLYLMRQSQDLQEKAAPATSIKFTPPNKTILVDDNFDVTVDVDTTTNVLAGLELEVNYDTQKLNLVSLAPGSFLPTPLASPLINNDSGSATISVGAQVSNPPQGKGTVATLKFKAKAPGNATLTFGPKTKASSGAKGEGTADLIASRQPSTITIIATAASPSPSPASAGAPSPSPSPAGAVASPSPSAAPSGGTGGAASPSPSASSKASSSPSPSSSTKPIVTLPANKTVAAGTVITGTAVPNSTVTITIQSDPITATVKADSAGKWSYTIPSTLAAGTHTLTVTDSNGTYTTTFTVSGTQGGVSTPSGSTPAAGTSWPTLLAISAGLLFVIFGTFLAAR